jgi:putative glycosyltransferase (TIGR04348 family)
MMARIVVVVPPSANRDSGNFVTAHRYRRHLQQCGHSVRICQGDDSLSADLLIALQARKTAAATLRFARDFPSRPRVVVLTGTDLYSNLRQQKTAAKALDAASRVVVFHPLALAAVPTKWQSRCRVIGKSAERLAVNPLPLKRHFEFSVSGHLRPVKDPFRGALAARKLPAESRIVVSHFGNALSEKMAQRAAAEMVRNSRYRYLGGLPLGRARQRVARSRALILSSRLEGGANVIAEAIVSGVPVLASRVSGNIGMLGADWPGYFEAGNTLALTELMFRCEKETAFYQDLLGAAADRALLFLPGVEQAALAELTGELLP